MVVTGQEQGRARRPVRLLGPLLGQQGNRTQVRAGELVKKKYERKDEDKSAQMDLLYVQFPAFVDRLIERLAALEHDQWMNWAKVLLQQETLSAERRKRWAEIMVPYPDLAEDL